MNAVEKELRHRLRQRTAPLFEKKENEEKLSNIEKSKF